MAELSSEDAEQTKLMNASANQAVDCCTSPDNIDRASKGSPGSTPSSPQQSGRLASKTPCIKKLRVALIAVTVATFGSTLFGLDIGYIGPILESGSFRHDIAHIDSGSIPSETEGLIVSLFSIGAIVTSCPVVSGHFLDVWGRKASMFVGALVFILGSFLQGAATGAGQLLAGRFVAGMSIGLLSSVVSIYISELAPETMRGNLGSLYQMGITFGILVAAYIDQLIVDRKGGWRMVMAIICAPAAGLVLSMAFLPRSPRWLVQIGERKEALKVLYTVRSEDEAIREELDIHHEYEKARKEGIPAWSELLHGRVARLLLLGVTLQLLQQLVGMNAFMYFGPKIFESIGFSANKFTTVNNFINFLSTFPAVFMADMAGRRSLMLWSCIGMTLACMVMGTVGLFCVTKIEDDPATPADEASWQVSSQRAGWTIACCAFFFVFNFAYGLGPVVWVYVSEIFPLRYKARCFGVCTMANWIGNFLVAQFTPMMLDSIQFSTFYVFGFFCTCGMLLSAWLPETKGVPLETMQQLFDHKAGFRSTAQGKGSNGIEMMGCTPEKIGASA